MSTNGIDDDDIEDKLERLISELSQLNDIIRRSMRGAEPEEEEDEGFVDKWNVGQISQSVESIEEYQVVRQRAARSEEVSSPWLNLSGFDSIEEKLAAYVEMFRRGVINLEEANAKLSNDNFREFFQVYAIQVSSMQGEPVINKELVSIVDPTPQFFGVSFVEDEVVIDPLRAHYSMVRAWGYTWHGESNPQAELNLPNPESFERIVGERSPIEVNEALASVAFDRMGSSLPAKFVDLLDDDDKRRYFS